jgi:hypothetical protein
MTTLTKSTLAVAIAAVLLGAYATIATITEHSQISQLRNQLAQAHTTQGRAEHLISAQQAKLAGEHRDLVTCADINELLNGFTGPNPNGYIGLNQYLTANAAGFSMPLPSHCLNQ